MSAAEGEPAAGIKKTAGGKESVIVDFAALLVKQADGRWLLASIRSDGERSLRTPHARLKVLEWLIGEWVDESDESTMHSKTRWSDDGHFIITDFTIRVVGRKVMNITQRIGWDGSLEKFKSWVFAFRLGDTPRASGPRSTTAGW